jgi:hypothetical protein
MVNGKGENGSEKYPKTYVITAAQAIQSKKHADEYGEDDSKGAPNIPLIENMDRYVDEHDGESMILQMQGMNCSEMDLHDYFEDRTDVYMNKNKLLKFETMRRHEKEKLESKMERVESKIENAKKQIENKKEKKKNGLEKITERKEELEEELKQLEEDFEEMRGTDYFNSFKVKCPNQKCAIVDVIVPPQNVDPTTGRMDISQTQLEKTIIFAHSKQRLRCAPKSIGIKFPRIVMTTGTVTFPNYNTTNSRGDAAEWNHKYGFVVVDVLSARRYLPRIVPAREDGTFVDMGMLYEPGKEPRKIKTEALIPGDIHLGYENPDTMKANFEMIEFFAPKNVFLHDALDGHSVNPHEREDTIRRAIAFRKGKLDIKTEFSDAYDLFIKEMAKQFPKTNFHFVYSNHSSEFFERYLTDLEFTNEPWNDNLFVSALRNGLLMEENLIKKGLELIALEDKTNRLKGKSLPKNVHCLDLDEGMILKGYQLGVHGHRGVNGARGSPNGMKSSYGRGIFGHIHTPEINGDCITVGTSSIIPLDYQKGQPGTSMPANGVLYENGLAQLIPIIVGKWNKNI